jgi:cytoskeletal protein CcmA (bactofilin family)
MMLFKQSDDDGPDKVPPPGIGRSRPIRSNNTSVIASTLRVEGKPSATEGLLIEGRLECTTAHHQKHLTVGEYSRVKANIHASTVTVFGQLVGNIHSKGMVWLAKSANVKGDIFCACLFIEEGARVEGKIEMGKTTSIAATPQR